MSLCTCVPVDATGAASSQQTQPVEWVIVEATSTAKSGRSVYIDKGRDQGLEPGDPVQFFPPGQPFVSGEIRSVSSQSARVELFQDEQVSIGVRAEARIPRSRLDALQSQSEAAEDAPPTTPEHPPWQRGPVTWDDKLPLLAPLEEIKAVDRETRLRGRSYLQADRSWDNSTDGTDTSFLRAGVDLGIENPFRAGGLFDMDVSWLRRASSTSDASDEFSDDQLQVRRLSYALGGTRHRPWRLKVGRFLQEGMPEFGLLDGVELTRAIGAGTRVGFSTGWQPELDVDLSTGDDYQVAAFLLHELDNDATLVGRLGYQKTWHRGTPDRDLVATGLNWRPGEELSLDASALIDHYNPSDEVKSSGFELTELHLYGNWRPSRKGGVSLGYDQVRWPELLRSEFVPVPESELEDQDFRRGNLRIWRRLTDALQLSLRGDLWRNDRDEGSGGEFRAEWSQWPWKQARLSARVFTNEGQFNSLTGAGARLEHNAAAGRWALAYEAVESTQDDFLGAQGELSRDALRASWDGQLAESWSLSISVAQLFGDQQDAFLLAFYLQQRF